MTKMPEIGAYVKVDWVDSHTFGRWMYMDEMQEQALSIVTVGVLTGKFRDRIVVSVAVGHDETAGNIVIPRACIKQVRILR